MGIIQKALKSILVSDDLKCRISQGRFISYLVFLLPALWMLLVACGGGGGGGGDHP